MAPAEACLRRQRGSGRPGTFVTLQRQPESALAWAKRLPPPVRLPRGPALGALLGAGGQRCDGDWPAQNAGKARPARGRSWRRRPECADVAATNCWPHFGLQFFFPNERL